MTASGPSDTDRERATVRLSDHYAEGRLTREELDERVTAALSARTFGDLRRVMADLPEPAPTLQRARTLPPAAGPRPVLGRGGPLILPLAALVLLWALLLPGGGWPFLAFFQVLLVFSLAACATWHSTQTRCRSGPLAAAAPGGTDVSSPMVIHTVITGGMPGWPITPIAAAVARQLLSWPATIRHRRRTPAPARPLRPLVTRRVHRRPDCGGRMTGDRHVNLARWWGHLLGRAARYQPPHSSGSWGHIFGCCSAGRRGSGVTCGACLTAGRKAFTVIPTS